MVTLEVSGNEKIEDPKPEDFDRALAQPRDDDWYVELWRNDDDFLEASVMDGAFRIDCEVDGKWERAQSYVDDEKLKAMLADFAAGGTAWREMALWADPPKAATATAPNFKSVPAMAAAVFGAFMLAAILFGGGRWAVAVFALAFPGVIAVAAYSKMQDVKRAKAWSKGSGKIIRSELVTRTVNGKEVEVPAVEYEFTMGMDFNKIRGNRVTLAEIEGPHGAQEILARYRVGTSVPVYYNPANPGESVLERDMPANVFVAIWSLVAVLTLGVLGGIYWFLLR